MYMYLNKPVDHILYCPSHKGRILWKLCLWHFTSLQDLSECSDTFETVVIGLNGHFVSTFVLYFLVVDPVWQIVFHQMFLDEIILYKTKRNKEIIPILQFDYHTSESK